MTPKINSESFKNYFLPFFAGFTAGFFFAFMVFSFIERSLG